MRKSLASWADRHLIDGWRGALRLYSVRFNLIIGLAAIAVAILGYTSDEVKSLIGWDHFAELFGAVSLIGLFARLWDQSRGKKGDDDADA